MLVHTRREGCYTLENDDLRLQRKQGDVFYLLRRSVDISQYTSIACIARLVRISFLQIYEYIYA